MWRYGGGGASMAHGGFFRYSRQLIFLWFFYKNGACLYEAGRFTRRRSVVCETNTDLGFGIHTQLKNVGAAIMPVGVER